MRQKSSREKERTCAKHKEQVTTKKQQKACKRGCIERGNRVCKKTSRDKQECARKLARKEETAREKSSKELFV